MSLNNRIRNPFVTGSAVDPALFVGRSEQLDDLCGALDDAANGRPQKLVLNGERGTGKTSLLTYLRSVARGDRRYSDLSFRFLVVDFDFGARTSQNGLLTMLMKKLDSQVGSVQGLRAAVKQAWKALHSFEVVGVRYERAELPAEIELIIDDLSSALVKASLEVCGQSGPQGILITLDECDRATPELGLGELMRRVLERAERNGCRRIMTVFSGLPQVKSVLSESHKSTKRYKEIVVGKMPEPELVDLLALYLRLGANENGAEEIRMTSDAEQQLILFSEGYPHFLQVFGQCAFDHCAKSQMGEKVWYFDANHVISGATVGRAALDTIGDVYYRDEFDAFTSIERRVAEFVAEHQNELQPVAALRDALGSDRSLDEALQCMLKAGTLVKDDVSMERTQLDEPTDRVRLRDRAFAFWIHFAKNPECLPIADIASKHKLQEMSVRHGDFDSLAACLQDLSVSTTLVERLRDLLEGNPDARHGEKIPLSKWFADVVRDAVKADDDAILVSKKVSRLLDSYMGD
ncbi:MAG: ATP-binding protein [Planctomycetota bacterium]